MLAARRKGQTTKSRGGKFTLPIARSDIAVLRLQQAEGSHGNISEACAFP
jgi:hypothetical protein